MTPRRYTRPADKECPLCGWSMLPGTLGKHVKAHRIFWTKVNKTDTCWLWTGGVSAYGYPVAGGQIEPYAHRRSYLWLVGPIPPTYEVDHLCRVKLCVRPDHLEAVSKAENIRRQNALTSGTHQRSLTHCPQGHPYSGENLVVRREGWRTCRTCKVARVRAWRARQKAVAA